jgi:prepilin-type N-terminal cleavage/methylation domain-containing protein
MTCPAHSRSRRAGVTLLEMLIVMAIIALLVGIAYPGVTSGLDSLKLTQSADQIASFLNGALNRAERHQQPVEVVVLRRERKLQMITNEPGFLRELELPKGVEIVAVLPAVEEDSPDEPRRVLVMPGGTPPGIGIRIRNLRGVERIVHVDPMTGFPRIESVVKE